LVQPELSTTKQPLPISPSARTRIVRDHAKRLLDSGQLTEEEQIRVQGALRALESSQAGALTRPGVRRGEILDAAARDVAAAWERINGEAPWQKRPLIMAWLDRFWR
jgi:hypothetical protein